MVSEVTYPVVYVFPLRGFSSAKNVAALAIQAGKCVSDLIVKSKVGLISIVSAQWVAVVSEVTCPMTYVFPMSGLSSAKTVVVVAIQVGHYESDLIVEREVGLILIFSAQWVAVVSEVTYPAVYAFPLRGLSSRPWSCWPFMQASVCRTSL